jgi:hypothetical protein
MNLTHNDNQVNQKNNSFVTGSDELPLSHSNIKSFNLAESNQLKAKFRHVGLKIIPLKHKSTRTLFRLMIDMFGCNTKVIRPCHQTIANITGYSVKTSQRAMKELHDHDLIHCCRRGKRESNVYTMNWKIIKFRSDMLEDYGKEVKGHFVSRLLKPKGLSYYHNNNDINFKSESVKEEVKDDPGDGKPEVTSDNVILSKKSRALMESKGIRSFLKQNHWEEKWRLAMKQMPFHKGKNGNEEWNHRNANYFFEWFIRHEIAFQIKKESRYIPLHTRLAYKNSQKPVEPKPIHCYSTHSTFSTHVKYEDYTKWTSEEEKQGDEEFNKWKQ